MDPYGLLNAKFKCRSLREADDVGKRSAQLDRGLEEAKFTTLL